MLDYFRTPRVPIKTPLAGAATVTEILPLWEVPFQLAERVRGSSVVLSETWHPYTLTATEAAGGTGGSSGHAKRMRRTHAKFAPLAGGSGNGTAIPVEYVLVNAPQTVAHVLNVSVGLLVSDTDQIIASHTLIQCILAGAAVVLVLGVFLLYNWSFRRVNIEKAIALHLFTTIPFGMLEELLANAEKTLKKFDKPDGEGQPDERLKLAAALQVVGVPSGAVAVDYCWGCCLICL